MMMLIGLWWCLITTFFPLQSGAISDQTPILLFSKIISEHCASFEVFDHGETLHYYQSSYETRDKAAFYYTDEDKEEIIIQKKLSDSQFSLKYIFVAHKKTYEIILKTCSEHLVKNKKELFNLQQKVINKETL